MPPPPNDTKEVSAGGVEQEEVIVVTIGDVDDERGLDPGQTFNTFPPHTLPDEWLVAEYDKNVLEIETSELDIEANR
jgi:hypothetical protein